MRYAVPERGKAVTTVLAQVHIVANRLLLQLQRAESRGKVRER